MCACATDLVAQPMVSAAMWTSMAGKSRNGIVVFRDNRCFYLQIRKRSFQLNVLMPHTRSITCWADAPSNSCSTPPLCVSSADRKVFIYSSSLSPSLTLISCRLNAVQVIQFRARARATTTTLHHIWSPFLFGKLSFHDERVRGKIAVRPSHCHNNYDYSQYSRGHDWDVKYKYRTYNSNQNGHQ